MLRYRLSILFVLLFAVYYGHGQVLPFENYSLKQGLPASNVRTLFQDDQGYLWIGTEAGMCKYDGKKFSKFESDDLFGTNIIVNIIQDRKNNLWLSTHGGGLIKYDHQKFTQFASHNSDSLFADHINEVVEDRDGNIWMATIGYGLAKYIVNQDTVIYYLDKGCPAKTIISLIEASNGDIWIGTKELSAYRYDGKKFHHYNAAKGVTGNYVSNIYEDHQQNILLGTRDSGLFLFNNHKFTHYTTKEGLTSNSVTSITQDKNDTYWIGTTKGISLMDKNGQFTTINKTNGLTGNHINQVYIDHQDVTWICIGGFGIDKFSSRRFQIFNEAHGLKNVSIHAIGQDTAGHLWFGTEGGAGKLEGQEITMYTKEDGLPDGAVMGICTQRNGTLWAVTFGGGIAKWNGKRFEAITKSTPKLKFNNTGLSFNYVWSVCEDHQGNMWFGTYAYGVDKFDGKSFTNYNSGEGLAGNIVVAIFEDSKQRLWFGTYGAGVSMLENGKFTNYNTQQGLSNNNIWDIHEDKEGLLYFATDFGLNIFDGTKFDTLNKKDGLKSNTCWLVTEDSNGNLWVGHEKGVERINKATGSIRYYGYVEGFTPIEVSGGAVYNDKDENLWFGTVKGVVKYSPGEDVPNPHMPRTHITDIKLFNREVKDWRAFADTFNYRINQPVNLFLPFDQNFLSFKYVGIFTETPEKVKYKYMLEGFETEWNPETENTEASYSNLQPGDYVFKVLACSAEGIWNEEAETFSFTIDLPFWQKWWFYAIEISFLLLLFTLSIYLNQRGANERIATALIFISLLIVVEFMIMLLENAMDQFTGGVPVVKLVLNVVLAVSFSPIEKLASRWIRARKYKKRLDAQIDRFNLDSFDSENNKTNE